jgi:hypothetical protein
MHFQGLNRFRSIDGSLGIEVKTYGALRRHRS